MSPFHAWELNSIPKQMKRVFNSRKLHILLILCSPPSSFFFMNVLLPLVYSDFLLYFTLFEHCKSFFFFSEHIFTHQRTHKINSNVLTFKATLTVLILWLYKQCMFFMEIFKTIGKQTKQNLKVICILITAKRFSLLIFCNILY